MIFCAWLSFAVCLFCRKPLPPIHTQAKPSTSITATIFFHSHIYGSLIMNVLGAEYSGLTHFNFIYMRDCLQHGLHDATFTQPALPVPGRTHRVLNRGVSLPSSSTSFAYAGLAHTFSISPCTTSDNLMWHFDSCGTFKKRI